MIGNAEMREASRIKNACHSERSEVTLSEAEGARNAVEESPF